MSIKFSCPHCSKTLKVRDELAGKKGACPGCRKVVLIPVHTVMTPSRSGSSVIDLESLAAETLAEKKVEAAVATTIALTCPWCDENVKFATDLGGKQAPCPSCKRLVKVPMAVKTGPRDWRKPEEDRLPSGAMRTDAAPEGAWGTEAARGVSREALVEADVIKEVRDPITVRSWIILGTLLTVLLVGGIWGGGKYFSWSRGKAESNAVNTGRDYLKENKGTPALQCVLRTGLGTYYERGKTEATDYSGLQQLQQARLALMRISDPFEKHGVARELLRTLVELDQSGEELGLVLAQVPPGLGREEVVREMCRRSLSAATGDAVARRAEKLRQAISGGVEVVRSEATPGSKLPTTQEPDAAEQNACLAILGQELVRANRSDMAQSIAEPIRAQHKPTRSFPVQLQALLIMLQKPELEAGREHEQDLLAGRALGSAWAGNMARATDTLAVEQFRGLTIQRAQVLLAVAEALIEKDQKPRADELIKQALAIFDTFPSETAWHRQRVVEILAASGSFDEAERMADVLLAGSARDWARVAVFQARLRTQPADPSGITAGSSAHATSLLALGRAKGRADGKSAFDWVESLDEAVRPFASIGVALGMREGQ